MLFAPVALAARVHPDLAALEMGLEGVGTARLTLSCDLTILATGLGVPGSTASVGYLLAVPPDVWRSCSATVQGPTIYRSFGDSGEFR